MRRPLVAVVGSVVVIAAVVSIIVISLVPLPEFSDLDPGIFDTSIVFVDDNNCVQLADLRQATVTELRCEPEQGWIDDLEWSESGVEITTYLNQPVTRVLDPSSGEVIDTRTGDEEAVPERPSLLVDRLDDDEIVVYDDEGQALLVLTAPERYWIEFAVTSADGELVALVDSVGRLAVFDRQTPQPRLVSQSARSWPYPAWAP